MRSTKFYNASKEPSSLLACVPINKLTKKRRIALKSTTRKDLRGKENKPGINPRSKRAEKRKNAVLHRSTNCSLHQTEDTLLTGTSPTTVEPFIQAPGESNYCQVKSPEKTWEHDTTNVPAIETASLLKSSLDLLSVEETMTEEFGFYPNNKCSTPNSSKHVLNFSTSAVVPPSPPFHNCACKAEQKIDKLYTEMKELRALILDLSKNFANMQENDVTITETTLNQVVENNINTSFTGPSGNRVVCGNMNCDSSGPALSQTQDMCLGTQDSMGAQNWVHNQNSTAIACGATINCPESIPSVTVMPTIELPTGTLAVMSPITDFHIRVLDSATLDHIQVKAKNEPHRFAQLLFQEVVPFQIYKNWTHKVNYDGSRDKQPLPENLRNLLTNETRKRFVITPAITKKITDTINAILRMPRKIGW